MLKQYPLFSTLKKNIFLPSKRIFQQIFSNPIHPTNSPAPTTTQARTPPPSPPPHAPATAADVGAPDRLSPLPGHTRGASKEHGNPFISPSPAAKPQDTSLERGNGVMDLEDRERRWMWRSAPRRG
jgi:hypothetical protein